MSSNEGLAAFCEEQYPRLVRWLGLYCGDVHVAEEIAQDVLATVCAHWNRVRTTTAPAGWVHRVAVNRAHSYFRRRAAARRALKRLGARSEHVCTDEYHLPDPRLRDAINELPDRQRTALLLRHAAGLTVTEAARSMDTSEQAVRNLTHRATSRLREILGSTTRRTAP